MLDLILYWCAAHFLAESVLVGQQGYGIWGTEDLVLVSAWPHISWVTLGKSFIQQTFIEGFSLENYRNGRCSFCPQGAQKIEEKIIHKQVTASR